MSIPIEVSARHLHVSQEHLDILFGDGYKLTKKKDLSQLGQYACDEKVEVIGSKSSFKMTILGPVRKSTQIEISATDARTIGVEAVLRHSGDTDKTPGVILKGPKGEVVLDEGVIVALRHIHLSTDEAKELGVVDKDVVKIKTDGSRAVTFKNVLIRVDPTFRKAMHIDTDEANAAFIKDGAIGEIIKHKHCADNH